MSVEGMVEAAIVWAVAAWVVALGMLVGWLVRKRRERRDSIEVEEHERPVDDWPFR